MADGSIYPRDVNQVTADPLKGVDQIMKQKPPGIDFRENEIAGGIPDFELSYKPNGG